MQEPPKDDPKPEHPRPFPSLTIIQPPAQPAPARLSTSQKYGGLFYLGVGGLILIVSLVSWFGYQVYAMRDVFGWVYLLHDDAQPEAIRVQAAFKIARDERINDRQRVDIALRKGLPTLARYLVAEGLTTDSLTADANAFAKMVAYSEGWPDWLRLMFLRVMAYGAGEGYRFPWDPVNKLREHKDPSISLFATYTKAAMEPGDEDALAALKAKSREAGPYQELAAILYEGASQKGAIRRESLDRATKWLREKAPEVKSLWSGWVERDGDLLPAPPS
jgi:hypothetical protein